MEVGRIVFNGNTAPRVRKKLTDAKTWLCVRCYRENGPWLKQCPGCGAPRDK